jgi:hypothetical protein
MRNYLHGPDERFLAEELARQGAELERCDDILCSLFQSPLDHGQLHLYGDCVDTVFTVARLEWSLGAPVQRVAESVRKVCDIVRAVVGEGVLVDAFSAGYWLQLALIGGDGSSARRLGEQIEGSIAGRAPADPLSCFMVGVRALLSGSSALAKQAAEVLCDLAQTANGSARDGAFLGLAPLLKAVAAKDQAAFDAALGARRDALIARYGRTLELRRSAYGLFDLDGASLARLAGVVGLRLPVGDPYFATDLLNELPWFDAG